MKRCSLNNDGLNKFLPYLLEAASKGKLLIKDNVLRVGDMDIMIAIPTTEVISEYGEAAATQGPIGVAKDPSASVPNTSQAGRKTGVKKLGRANKDREEDMRLKEMVKKLGKMFLTQDEFKRYMDKMDKDKPDINKLQKAFNDIGSELG